MWKIGGLVFTYPQLVQLFNHIRPGQAEKANNNSSVVYQAVISLALKKNLDLIAVDVTKPKGGQGTRYILCIYSKPARTETKTNFEKWQEGGEVERIRKWLSVRGVKKRLPFDTFMI